MRVSGHREIEECQFMRQMDFLINTMNNIGKNPKLLIACCTSYAEGLTARGARFA